MDAASNSAVIPSAAGSIGVVHAIFFALKRAYQSSLSVTRVNLAPFGLTPARFDMLYAIAQKPVSWISQSELRETLGVSAPVVSRMLSSLEKLGLLFREKACGDRRRRVVALTREGRSAIGRACQLMWSGAAQLAVDCIVAGTHWFNPSATLVAVDSLQGMLHQVRYECSDGATLSYPWHPDD